MSTTAATTPSVPPLREELRRLFAKLKLPTSPALACQILAAADDPDTTTKEFADLIRADAALSARLLRMANTAQFVQRVPVTTISRAVAVLGLARVRTAALSFQLVGHLNRLGKCRFPMQSYWQQSVLRGCVARTIAELVVPDLVEEASLVGTLQDCGIPLLVQILGEPYAGLYDRGLEAGPLSPVAFFSVEKERFPYNHVDAGVAMLEEWKLPAEICVPVARHHQPVVLTPDSTPLDRLAAVSYLVGSMRFGADLVLDPSETSLSDFAREQLRIPHARLEECLAAAGRAYTAMKDLLGESLPEDVDVTELLSEANRQLTIASSDAEARRLAAESQRDLIEKEHEHLKCVLGEYRERAARDPLTGLLNRGALLEAIGELIGRVRQAGESLSVYFLDLDNFKKLNDTNGHKTGDTVLQAVAAVLPRALRNSGIAGRYGGEEFIVAVPGLSIDEARATAQQIVELVRSVFRRDAVLSGRVTCSVGAFHATAGSCISVEQLVGAADTLMYQAKRGGKDCFRMEVRSADTGPASNHEVTASPGSFTPEPATLTDGLRQVATRLSLQGSRRDFVEMRKQPRHAVVAQCTLYTLNADASTVVKETAFVRNITGGGLGLVTSRPLHRGAPIEVELSQPSGKHLYVAGIVSFCRHVEGSIHDVGVQLCARGEEPILAKNPAIASSYPWLAEALTQLSGSGR